MTYDLGIEFGIVVGPRGSAPMNVYIGDGRVALVTSEQQESIQRVDATGMLVMPGMVDSHVHLMDPGDPGRESFPDGTAAALRSGVTTVIEHRHGRPDRDPADFEAKAQYLTDRSRTDFALAAHVWPGEVDAAIDAWNAGAAYLKVFTCTTHGVPGHTADAVRAVFGRGAGLGAVFLVHAEDETLTAAAERELRAAGRHDGEVIPEWRSLDAELAAVTTVARLARETGATAVIAHASCREAVAAAGRFADTQVKVETCPQYLTLLRREALTQGALRKFTPPARAAGDDDLAEMWSLVAGGNIDVLSSDHAPSTLEQKRSAGIWDVHFGLPGLDTTMGLLLDGAAAGRITYEKLVELYAERPAQLYGLWPQKGSLDVGADADVVIVDPRLEWTVEDRQILSRAGWSPYSGRRLKGRAVRTYVRGLLAMDGGKVLAAPGNGRLLRGAGAARTPA